MEQLEERNLLTAAPFGASEVDTGEFMLGDVTVTVVAFESDGTRDPSLEDWNDAYRESLKTRIRDGLQWWEDTLDISFPNHQHHLNYQIDFTFLDAPIQTSYEPISRPSFDFQLWTADFFDQVGFNNGDFSSNSRAFNDSQREANSTEWAFTIFVVNDENDADGRFEPGGFDRAFAFSGGRFFISPAGRPDSTFAHETGHMFWGRDEYRGGGNFTSVRGYYNAQNLNAWDNPVFLSGAEEREASIMDRGACEESGGLLCTAFQNHSSSESSFAMIGWADSDGDGIFDVLDVPLALEGSGSYDTTQGEYHFVGTSSVQTLPNQNTSGPQNDITTNQISQAEYRIDGGSWIRAQRFDDYTANLDLKIPVPAGAQIQIRTIDEITGVASPVFDGTTARPTSTLMPGISGFVWRDDDTDGIWDQGEPALPNRTVRLIDDAGSPLGPRKGVEPDDYPSQSTLLNTVIPEVTLASIGNGTFDNSVVSIPTPIGTTNTGTRVFANFCGSFCAEWTKESRRLRMVFTQPVTTVSINAIAKNSDDRGRLEIYDANDNLLGRYTTEQLAAGQAETMTLSRPTAEIAYALAGAHLDRTILLDDLQFGAETSAITDGRGVFRLEYLEPDTYNVQLVPVGGDQPTAPASGQQAVTVAAGQAIGEVDFGVSTSGSRWQNPANRFDVNNDGFITPNDVLLIINDLNAIGPHTLQNEPTPPYRDVNGDGLVTANDVLHVINEINASSGGEGESGAAMASYAPPSSDAPGPEAEGRAEPANLARDAATFSQQVVGEFSQTVAAVQIDDTGHHHDRHLGWRYAADVHADRRAVFAEQGSGVRAERTRAAHDQVLQSVAEDELNPLLDELDAGLVDQLAASIHGIA